LWLQSYKSINSKQTDISKHKSIIGTQQLSELNISATHVISSLCTGIGRLSPTFITTVIFSSNFIGIVFARSLHYQFYCWYFHMLPYLLSHCTQVPLGAKLAVLLAIEVCFNVYPATWWSSALLQVLFNHHHYYFKFYCDLILCIVYCLGVSHWSVNSVVCGAHTTASNRKGGEFE
jgi:hypothetical protein